MEISPRLQEIEKGHWLSLDDDPWFKIDGPFEPGRYRLKFVGHVAEDLPATAMKLYYADEVGMFSEARAMVLGRLPRRNERRSVRLTIELPQSAQCLRFDPQQVPGKFHLARLLVRRLHPTPPQWKNIKTWLGLYRLRFSLANRRANAPTQPADAVDELPRLVLDSLPNVVPMNLTVQPAEPRLNVLIPGMAMRAMSGGPNTALNLTYRMAEAGVPLRYISTDIDMDHDHGPLWNHLQSLTGIRERLPNVEIVSAHDRSQATLIGSDDVFFGTAWWTVQMIKHALPMMRHKQFLYIIQDFEPALYAWSSHYALALETYGLDFRGILCSRLLADYFRVQRVGRFADPTFMERRCTWFEPALDETKFFFDPSAHMGKKRLLFYARPSAPRNLFELGLVALKRAVARGAFPSDEWDLRFMGEALPSHDLGHGVIVSSHPWSNYEDYSRLLRGADVGLSLMLSPHTSYPPLEIAASGATVVTNTYSEKTVERLSNISRNILPVEPNVEAIVEGLIEAARRTPDIAARRQSPINGVPRSWKESFRDTLPAVLRMWNECQNAD